MTLISYLILAKSDHIIEIRSYILFHVFIYRVKEGFERILIVAIGTGWKRKFSNRKATGIVD